MKVSYLAVLLLSIALNVHAQGAASSTAKNQKPKPKTHGTPYSVVERDANSRVWESTLYEQSPSGKVVPRVHRYTELATGMHYLKGNQWVETEENIELLPTGGAAALRGEHQVYFPYDIYDGVVEVVTPDGRHLKSRPLAISYFDGTNSVLLAEITNSVGQLISSNQVIYTNAFTDIAADLLCTYRRSGFECDLVFRGQPPAPETFGLDSANTRLELLTEFFDTADPEQITPPAPTVLPKGSPAGNSAAAANASGLVDTMLKFGSMTMTHGRAFAVNAAGTLQRQAAASSSQLDQPGVPALSGDIPVSKTWAKLQNRTLLIEEVPVQSIAPSLQQLPAVPGASGASLKNLDLHRVSASRLLPPRRIAQTSTNRMQLAAAEPNVTPGVVLDYNIVNTQSNLTFRGDTTYYVSGAVNLSGTNIIEGGTVIKYDTNYNCAINILGTVQTHTGPYHPAVLTSVTDGSVGESISSSGGASCTGLFTFTVDNYTGMGMTINLSDDNGNYLINGDYINPGDSLVYSFDVTRGQHLAFDAFDDLSDEYYQDIWPSDQYGELEADYDSSSGDYWTSYWESGGPICTPPVVSSTGLTLANGGSLNDLIIRYLGTGIQSSGSYSVTNIQFVQCRTKAFNSEYAYLYAGNILISGSPIAFGGQDFYVQAEQVTYDNGTYVAYDPVYSNSPVFVVNSLITGVPNWGNTTIYTNKVVKLSSSSGVYQLAGAGSYYLATNSPYRNIGTTGINSALLASLSQRTTYAPTIYTSITISTNVEFGPKVLRDTDTPDLGYHYCPLDYCFGNVTVNGNITFDAGTAVGYFDIYSGNSDGIALGNHVTNSFNGNLASPCVLARYSTVQEGGNGNWTSKGYLAGISTVGNSSYVAQINANFTRCYALAWDPNHFRDYYAQLNERANNCEFYSGSMAGYWAGHCMTNCLFDCVAWVGSEQRSSGIFWRNCTMRRGNVFIVHSVDHYFPVSIENCIFDGSGTDMDNYAAGNTNITYCDYNAFVNGASRLAVNGAHDQVISNFTWQTGPLGNLYQSPSSPLINAGSVAANIVGLYHFTTQTNQAREGNSTVDIGYHYVATGCGGNDVVWVDDTVPAGASAFSDGGDSWTWVSTNPVPYSGQLASQSSIATGEHQHFFNFATATMTVNTGDTVFAYVYLDPTNVPSEVMLQWNDGGWGYRAYWGANNIAWGTDGTVSKYYAGPLPPAGQWVRLEVPASLVGLEGRTLQGMAFTLYGGRATWDYAGKSSTTCYDNDGDGIPNYLEDANGDGIYDAGDLANWNNPDTDGDGLSDGYEVAHGTNPLGFDNLQLGFWRFDNTFTWQGDYGQYPLTVLNLTGIPSWDTNAVLIDSTGASVLSYRDVEAAGTPNITVRSGTVRFWFRPDWSSASAGGVGPQKDGRFIELGAKGTTNGWWSLAIDSSGTNLYFGTETNSTASLMTNVSAGISWTLNIWHQAVLTYSPSNSSLYIDGQPVATNGAGVTVYPGAAARSQGFTIGSSASGTNQVRGAFDDLETFNYPLNASAISSNYNAVAHQDRDGNGLYDVWEMNHFGQLHVDPNADPDGDGLSNAGEMAAGTDPLVFNNARLGYWRFNNAPSWQDEQGLSPNVMNGLFPVPSWSGDAVKINPALYSSLGYPQTRADGSLVVTLPAGTIRFWFKPDWSSYDGNGGTGPGDTIRLFEMGQESSGASNGLFSLMVDSFGTAFSLVTQANGIQTTNASCPIAWNSNSWYQIVLTYSTANCALYVNGQVTETNSVGLTNYPSPTVLQAGFHLGSSSDGIHQANGLFDELETFNYVLSTNEIATNYQAIMSVDTDGDGLPDVTENALGSRPDAVDSDCDGLPDAWEVAHGLNPTDPSDATPAMLALYVQGDPNTNALVSVQTNLINVYFSSYSTDTNISTISGAAANSASNDIWNLCGIGSDYTNNGVDLLNAGGSASGAKLFAFIGPCATPLAALPTYYDWDWTQSTQIDETTVVTTNLTYSEYETNQYYFMFSPGRIYYNIWRAPRTFWITGGGPSTGGVGLSDWFFSNYFLAYCNQSPQVVGLAYDDFIYGFYNGLTPYIGTNRLNPFTFYYTFDNGIWEGGVYYRLPYFVRGDISYSVTEISSYESTLTNYFTNTFVTHQTATNYPPAMMLNAFMSPFADVYNHGDTVAENYYGALWNFSGSTNSLTGTGWDFPGYSNSLSGTFIRMMYPEAKRTMLINGLSPGNYDVYIYYGSSAAVSNAVINGVPSSALTALSGAKYWYANVDTVPMQRLDTYDQVVNAQVSPFALMASETNNCIQMDIDWPDVSSSSADIKIVGLQLVKQDLQLTNAVLQVSPGNQAAYLAWKAPFGVTNFNIYRAIGSTNTWSLLASTAGRTYQDTNLLVGTTYYYKVVGTNEPDSAIVAAVPFGCASPLPPRIDYVNQLQVPQNNGSYPVSYGLILTNSDAFDPQGYPMTFVVDSVASGSLMIDGLPYSAGHNRIGPTNSAVWTPPTVVTPVGTPAFRIYIDDGVNRSTNTVNVSIKQQPKTYLFGWGNNGSGVLGNGLIAGPRHHWDPFYYMAYEFTNGFIQLDPRWGVYTNDTIEYTPKRVLDLDRTISVFSTANISSAVDDEGQLWQWGYDREYSLLGMPLFEIYPDDPNAYPQFWEWGTALPSGFSLNPDTIWPADKFVLSPMLYRIPGPDRVVLNNVKTVCGDSDCRIVLKNDGTLWSWGLDQYFSGNSMDGYADNSTYILGRHANLGDDQVVWIIPGEDYSYYAVSPRMIQFEGNDTNGLDPQRAVVEVASSDTYIFPTAGPVIARCRDGSLWWWGKLVAGFDAGWNEIDFELGSSSRADIGVPTRLTCFDSMPTPAITQMSVKANHCTFLKADGSVWELGYIPGKSSDASSPTASYSSIPVRVAGLPGNVKSISAGNTFGTALTDDGNVWIWGLLDDTNSAAPRQITSLAGITKVVASCPGVSGRILALDQRGVVWGWGCGWCYQAYLGDASKYSYYYNYLFGNTNDTPNVGGYIGFYYQAVPIEGIENVTDIFCGADTAFALGNNDDGRPTHLSAAAMNQMVSLSWDNYTGASQYIIYRSLNRNSGYVAIGSSTTTSYLDQNPPLVNGQTYYYRVSAVVNGVETSPSVEAAAMPHPAPTVAINLSATWSCHGVLLQWQPPTNSVPSPVAEYIVQADGIQLAELFPYSTNYFDDRQFIASNTVYSVIARNSAGNSTNTTTISTNFIPCDPAPTVATNQSPSWLIIKNNDAGSDEATLVWAGPTNALSWLFQSSEFDTYPGIPGNGNYSGIPATETVIPFINKLADPYADPFPSWLWSQFTTNEAAILSNDVTQVQSVSDVIDFLAQADAVTNHMQAWLWSQFTTNETNSLLDSSSSDEVKLTALDGALTRVAGALQQDPTNQTYQAYVNQLYYQVNNTTGVATGDEINLKLNVLIGALNRIIGGGSVYSSSSFNGITLRSSTSALLNKVPAPTGPDLIQLNRMLLDDYFGGQYFTRGGNWGSALTGFRLHYRTVRYFEGRKIDNSYQQDIGLADLKYNLPTSERDDENIPCGVYSYSWSIPQGAVCWASISAIVNGREGEISTQLGPQAAVSLNSWDAELRAIPGYQQVYLDWADDPEFTSFDVYYSTSNIDCLSTNWQPVATSLTVNRCWHTNLAAGTNYYMVVANRSDGRYFRSCDSASPVSAVVTNMSPPSTNYFSADACPYDSMVLVEWTVPTNTATVGIPPLSQTNWQFFVERKPATTGDGNYQLITDSGYGLAYLDSDVVDGQAYTYRVTAFDASFNRLQALAVAKSDGTSTNITPSATNGLTLLPPQPGSGYVNLKWSPIRAAQFTIERGVSTNGPFDAVGNVFNDNAYQSAPNTYQDTSVQNGITYYYKVVATTPTGFQIESGVQSAMPLSTLTPLPPNGFHGTLLSGNGANSVLLSWNNEANVASYQVFLQNQSALTPLFSGTGLTFNYPIPADADSNAVFTFALRSVNSQGLTSDLVETVVSNQAPTTVSGSVTNPVVLQVAGVLQNLGDNPLQVTGPTNLTLSAEVNLPDVKDVSFYDGNELLGTVESAPWQMVWYHVPGGSNHVITAKALVEGNDLGSFISGGNSAVISSDNFYLNVTVEPQLSAYQTSATDLQLPAPALPISISRSYTSRSTDTNEVLGVGWTANWTLGTLKIATNLNTGWQGISQTNLGTPSYYISESSPHYVTVNLPEGGSVDFAPQFPYNQNDASGDSLAYDGTSVSSVAVHFESFAPGEGSLSTENDLLQVSPFTDALDDWSSVSFGPFLGQTFTYTSPDGTVYTYGQQSSSDSLTWLITRVQDRNGNSLTYNYNSDDTVQSISNSCGRSVTFSYDNPQTGVANISVSDMMGGPPSVVYVVTNNFLTEVHQLVDRGAGAYLTNLYVYGGDASHPADLNRITDVYDARGIKMLHNTYTNATGDLLAQISPGRTNIFAFDPVTYNLTISAISSSGTNTAKVTSDPSGAISGATQPVNGTNTDTSLAAQVNYDPQGNVASQTDAAGNTKTYTYDSQNRLVGQSDEDHNETSAELNAYGQPTISTDARGKQTLYEYDINGNLTNVRNPSGTATSYGYSTALTNSSAYLGPMRTSQSQDAPYVPYTIVTQNSYKSSGPILGDLSQMTQEWQDGNGTVVGTPVITSYQYDANGNRTLEVKQRTVGTNLQYITTAYTYDAMNRVIQTVVSASGAETLAPQTNTVTYNELGKQIQSVDAAGRTNKMAYDVNGNLIETVAPDGTVSRTCYDGFGRQQYVQDRAMPDGNNATTAPATLSLYDASGRVTNSVRLASLTLTKTSTTNGFQQLGTNAVYTMIASAAGTALSSNLTFYDVLGRVQYSVDARGAVTQNIYDPAGRRTNTLVYTQNAFAGALPPGGAVQSTVYTYDANGNQVSVTDGLGRTTTSVYDDANRVTEVHYPTAAVRYTSYDGLGRKVLETDEAGVSTAYTYDFRGRLTSVTLAFGTSQAATTVYEYDEMGNETKQIDAKGHTTTFSYDALGHRTSEELPGTQSNLAIYSAFGQIVTNYDFIGQRAEFRYDQFGRLTNKFYFVAGQAHPSNSVAYVYNELGRVTNITERYGDDASAIYAAADFYQRYHTASVPVKVIASMAFTAPKWGGPLTALGAVAACLTLLPGGRRLRKTLTDYYMRGGWRLESAWSGLPVRARRRLEAQAQSKRRLRLPSLFWRGATLVALACYLLCDQSLEQFWIARADCSIPSNGSTLTTRITNFVYDDQGRVLQANTPEGVINYSYDSATGQQTNLCTAYSSVGYGYDLLGRLRTVHVAEHNGTNADETTTYGYDPAGNRQSVNLPNNITTTYAYDSLNRLTNLIHQTASTVLANYSYALDATGRRTNATEVLREESGSSSTYLTNGLTWQFDSTHRLTNEISLCSTAGASYTNAFTYDAVGNRLKQVKITAIVTATTSDYDSNDQLLSETTSLNGAATETNNYAYDLNGSMIGETNVAGSVTTTTYGYNLMNKLGSVTGSGGTTSFQYNDQGIRVRTIGASTRYYLIDANNRTGYQQVLEEFTTLGSTPATSYVIGDDVLAQAIGGTASYLLHDGHGSTRQVASNTGSVTSRYSYDAYGITQAATSSASAETSLLYCGEQYDSALQMYNLRARYFNPDNGRFNQRDTYEGNSNEPQSLHKYVYCNADPMNRIDPTGNLTTTELVVVAATIAVMSSFGAYLSNRAGKSWARGALAGVALGVGVGFALEARSWGTALEEGFFGALIVATVDLIYNHFNDKNASAAGTEFDAFEAFSWGFLDGAIDIKTSGMPQAAADAFRSLGLNTLQALFNAATSTKDENAAFMELLTDIALAVVAWCVNLSVAVMTDGMFHTGLPTWALEGISSKLGRLVKEHASELSELGPFIVEKLKDVMMEAAKKWIKGKD